MDLREAIDRVAGNAKSRDEITVADRDVLDAFAGELCSHLNVAPEGQGRQQITAALALMYRAGRASCTGGHP